MPSRQSIPTQSHLAGVCVSFMINAYHDILTTVLLDKNPEFVERLTHCACRVFMRFALHIGYSIIYLNNRLEEINFEALNDLSAADFYKMLTKDLLMSTLDSSAFLFSVPPATREFMRLYGVVRSSISGVTLSVLGNDNITPTI